MADRRIYSAPGVDVRSIANAISNWFKARDFETQILMAPGGGYMIQARQPSSWRSVLGLSSALLVILTPRGGDLEVTTTAAKWADKVAVGAVGLVLHPLLITAAYGAWKQGNLPEEVFEMISHYLQGAPMATNTVPVGERVPPQESANLTSPYICPSCGQPTAAGNSYCPNCGSKLKKSYSINVD